MLNIKQMKIVRKEKDWTIERQLCYKIPIISSLMALEYSYSTKRLMEKFKTLRKEI